MMNREQVLEIRHKRARGYTQEELAEAYGVTVPTISYISRGVTHKDVGGPLVFGSVASDGFYVVPEDLRHTLEQ
jgi:transcriptional regulator with XRE-family HTH domain